MEHVSKPYTVEISYADGVETAEHFEHEGDARSYATACVGGDEIRNIRVWCDEADITARFIPEPSRAHRIGDGPWHLDVPSIDLPHATHTVRDADGWCVAHLFGTNARPQARLIAAAPELLDALWDLLEYETVRRILEQDGKLAGFRALLEKVS